MFCFIEDKRDYQPTTDARRLIDRYQLNKFQLVFSITKLVQKGRVPITYAATSAFSTVMVAKTTLLRYQDLNVRCVPRTGHSRGGDEVLIVIPRLDRRKSEFLSPWQSIGVISACLALELHFEHPSLDSVIPVEISSVDSKTVALRTPPCPRNTEGNQTLLVHIVIIQNNEEIARVEFLYYSSKFFFERLDRMSLPLVVVRQCPNCGTSFADNPTDFVHSDDYETVQ